MPKKKVTCAKCNTLYIQDVDTSRALDVLACPVCNEYGIMEMAEGFSLTRLPHPEMPRTTRWDCRMIERTLEGSVQYRELLIDSFKLARYEFIGFHGCGFDSARSMLRGGIDPAKNSVGARGRGFYVGSRYHGIAKTWAEKAHRKGQGLPTILAVYVRDFPAMTYGTHYDWGMMDGDDKVDVEGLEIVFFGDACKRLCVVPAVDDTAMSGLWQDCPRNSLSRSERGKVREAATALSLDYDNLANWIMRGKLDKHLTPEQLAELEKYF